MRRLAMRQEISTVIERCSESMKKKSLTKVFLSILIFVIGFSLISCDILSDDSTNIRIHNASEHDFQRVEVNTYDEPKNYGTIKSGEKSRFKTFEIAYRYAYVRLFVDESEFIIQPIDFVGETPLGSGKFTYVLEVIDFENKHLDIRAVKD